MIRADQLQIGDYVLVSGTPRRVESITKKKIGYHINPQTDKRLYYARLHDVKPIEITGEMLEQNGFDKRGLRTIYFREEELPDSYMWRITLDFQFKVVNAERCMHIIPKDATYNDLTTERNVFTESFYLHDLQHACRICGIKIDWKL